MEDVHLRTLSHVRSELRTRGEWPGAVRLRRGWSTARVRPWNDQTETVASLRLDKGGDRFIVACVDWLAGRGVEQVLSPAVAQDQSRVWRQAGFQDHLELVVYELDLGQTFGRPARNVEAEARPDLAQLAALDDRAFAPVWRVGRAGLSDALAATSLSQVLVVRDEDEVVGFAIVGALASVSYLQRLAVEPDRGGQGIGRSLVRASVDWARRRGARSMLLNTQPENTTAAHLYESEGFLTMGSRLRVLARQAGG